jgi:hypothetical protein
MKYYFLIHVNTVVSEHNHIFHCHWKVLHSTWNKQESKLPIEMSISDIHTTKTILEKYEPHRFVSCLIVSIDRKVSWEKVWFFIEIKSCCVCVWVCDAQSDNLTTNIPKWNRDEIRTIETRSFWVNSCYLFSIHSTEIKNYDTSTNQRPNVENIIHCHTQEECYNCSDLSAH